MTRICLIDDDWKRHMQLTDLIAALNDGGGAREYEASIPANEIQAKEYARLSINADEVWEQVATADMDSIFLVDLDFDRTAEHERIKPLRARFETVESAWAEKARSMLDALFAESPGHQNRFTGWFALAVLTARNIPRVLITQAEGPKYYQDTCTKWGVQMARPLAYDKDWEAWKEQIDIMYDYNHPLAIIKQMLDSYASPLSDDPDSWRHNPCQSETSINYGAEIWGFHEGFDEQTNKALHLRPKDWHLSIAASPFITKENLKQAVKRLDFPCHAKCEFDEPNEFYFPRGPGILFLLSLRELVEELGNRTVSPEMLFRVEDKLHSVRIALDVERSKGLKGFVAHMLDKHWINKTTFSGSKDEAREWIPDGGFSAAIFHFVHFRLGAISGNEEWARFFANGSTRWVTWPCVDEADITFYWTV